MYHLTFYIEDEMISTLCFALFSLHIIQLVFQKVNTNTNKCSLKLLKIQVKSSKIHKNVV